MCWEWGDAGGTGAPSKCVQSLTKTGGVSVGDAHEMWKSCFPATGRCCNDGRNSGRCLLCPCSLLPPTAPLGRGGKNQAAMRDVAIINPDPRWEGCNALERSSSAGSGWRVRYRAGDNKNNMKTIRESGSLAARGQAPLLPGSCRPLAALPSPGKTVGS